MSVRLRFCDSTNCRSPSGEPIFTNSEPSSSTGVPCEFPDPAYNARNDAPRCCAASVVSLFGMLDNSGERRAAVIEAALELVAGQCRAQRRLAELDDGQSGDAVKRQPEDVQHLALVQFALRPQVLRLIDKLLGPADRVPRNRHRLRLEQPQLVDVAERVASNLLDKRVAVQRSCAVTADQNLSAGVDAFGLSCSRRHDRCWRASTRSDSPSGSSKRRYTFNGSCPTCSAMMLTADHTGDKPSAFSTVTRCPLGAVYVPIASVSHPAGFARPDVSDRPPTDRD
jgi:hypothetical protein